MKLDANTKQILLKTKFRNQNREFHYQNIPNANCFGFTGDQERAVRQQRHQEGGALGRCQQLSGV